MTVIDNNSLIVGCIPVSAHPTPPEGQEDTRQEHCPNCNVVMWTSKKKRELRARNYLVVCFLCAIRIAGPKAKAIDLNKRKV